VSLSLTFNPSYVDSAFGPITGNAGSPLVYCKNKFDIYLVKGRWLLNKITQHPIFHIGKASQFLRKFPFWPSMSSLLEYAVPPFGMGGQVILLRRNFQYVDLIDKRC